MVVCNEEMKHNGKAEDEKALNIARNEAANATSLVVSEKPIILEEHYGDEVDITIYTPVEKGIYKEERVDPTFGNSYYQGYKVLKRLR